MLCGGVRFCKCWTAWGLECWGIRCPDSANSTCFSLSQKLFASNSVLRVFADDILRFAFGGCEMLPRDLTARACARLLPNHLRKPGATVFAQGSLRWSSLLLYLVVREVAMGDDLDSITKSHSRSLRRISRSSLTQECATERRM